MFKLWDNAEEYEVLNGRLWDCVSHVVDYEKTYNEDHGTQSDYLTTDGHLIKTDENIKNMLSDCEFSILDIRTGLEINYVGISEEI